jgi:hypothetical protein
MSLRGPARRPVTRQAPALPVPRRAPGPGRTPPLQAAADRPAWRAALRMQLPAPRPDLPTLRRPARRPATYRARRRTKPRERLPTVRSMAPGPAPGALARAVPEALRRGGAVRSWSALRRGCGSNCARSRRRHRRSPAANGCCRGRAVRHRPCPCRTPPRSPAFARCAWRRRPAGRSGRAAAARDARRRRPPPFLHAWNSWGSAHATPAPAARGGHRPIRLTITSHNK